MTTRRTDPVKRPIEQKVPLLDVSRSNVPLRNEILDAISQVVDSGQFVLGPACLELERSIAETCQTDFAIGCASGSDALLLALMALDIHTGDEVIVPSFTFFATASAVWRLGARPVFADIDPNTFNLDPKCVESVITSATKAILPVHLFGQCASMASIVEIGRRHHLHVVEDAAQALGATWQGQPAGTLGDVACFSFYPTKNLGGFGDGGMLTTSDEALSEQLKLLRGHGMHPRYFHQVVGINSRLDSIQAAALSVKLKHLDEWTRRRRENAARYTSMFRAAKLDQSITLPESSGENGHVWNQYTIRVPAGRRDALREHLIQGGVGTEIYYPIPLHQQACFQSLGHPIGSLPETERAAAEVLSLPIFPELTEAESGTVVARIAEFFGQTAGRSSRDVPTPKFVGLERDASSVSPEAG